MGGYHTFLFQAVLWLVFTLSINCINHHQLYFYNTNRGISSSSLLEQRYSPSNVMVIVAKMLMIHLCFTNNNIRIVVYKYCKSFYAFTYQSQLLGNPLYKEHAIKCIRNNVTLKSKHFFDFSTIKVMSTALYKWNKWLRKFESLWKQSDRIK